jgi:hypothetical protein
MMKSMNWRIGFALGLSSLLSACNALPFMPTPTPSEALVVAQQQMTPLGTPYLAQGADGGVLPTETPIPRQYPCFAPLIEDGTLREALLYRVDWLQTQESAVIQTLDGALELTAPFTFPGGVRWLAIVHGAPLPAQLALPIDMEPEATLLYDTNTSTYSVFSAEGRLKSEMILHPTADKNGIPGNMDIASVERIFGAAGGNVIRVTVTAPHEGRFIWTYEAVEITIGGYRYVNRTPAQGRVLNLRYNPEGKFADYTGSVVQQANTVTWSFDDVNNEPFSARTFTSAADWDVTVAIPIARFASLWQRINRSCWDVPKQVVLPTATPLPVSTETTPIASSPTP